MVEFWVDNPMLEMIFGIVSLLGVALLGWSNLMLQPPAPSVKMAGRSQGWPYRSQLSVPEPERD